MIKIKHARTADCVVAGFRWHKSGAGLVGSLLLGLYDDGRIAASRRRHLVVHDGEAQGAGGRARAAAERRAGRIIRGANGPRRSRRDDAHARRAEPLERGQGSVVGAAAHRAGLRGEVRPPAGRSLPPRRDRSCAGARTSRRADCRYDQLEVTTALRAREGFRRAGAIRADRARSASGSSSGIERLPAAAAAPPARAAG